MVGLLVAAVMTYCSDIVCIVAALPDGIDSWKLNAPYGLLEHCFDGVRCYDM